MEIKINQLKPHPDNAKIYGVENVDELVLQITASGWIKPLVVTDFYGGFTIVSGHRRHAAGLKIGADVLPCEVEHFDSEWQVMERLLLENDTREKTFEQRTREYSARKVVEAARAKWRMLATQNNKAAVEIFPQQEQGKSRDIAAEQSGFGSGKTAAAAEAVVKAMDNLTASGETEKADLLRESLEQKNISGTKAIMDRLDEMPKEDAAEYAADLKAGNKTTTQVRKEIEAEKKEGTKAHVSNNSGENEWYTPEQYINSARLVMERIDLDPASSLIANRTVKAENIFTVDDDGLTQSWRGNIWMNPPYSQPLISQFIEKLAAEKTYRQAIVLVNNATETAWGQRLIEASTVVCLHKGRIRFIDPQGQQGQSPLQGQMICYIGENVSAFILEFSKYGICLNVAK